MFLPKKYTVKVFDKHFIPYPEEEFYKTQDTFMLIKLASSKRILT